ncbi:MAG TPA: CBS domain-containing protein [Gemmatimonadales bacterium]
MQAKDLMCPNPATCSPDTPIAEAARLMNEYDCGCLPVEQEHSAPRVVGVITDRDIATRAVARGKSPDTRVRDIMSADPSCCYPDDDVKSVERIMAERQVRRVPVVNGDGGCVGIIAQADLARSHVPARELARTVERISEPSPAPRRESPIGVHPARQ